MEHRLSNDALTCSLSIGDELRLDALVWASAATPLLAGTASLVTVAVDGVVLGDVQVEQAAQEVLDVSWTSSEVRAWLRLRLDGGRLLWEIDLQGDDRACRIGFPFLAQLSLDGSSEPAGVRDAAAFRDGTGRAMFRHADWSLPAAWLGVDGTALTLLGGPTEGVRSPVDELASSGMEFVAPPERRTVWAAELVAHQGGWTATWELFRQRVRSNFDLSQYDRADTQWYGDQLVQHFTFLYGREILNLDTGAFEIDRFLDEAERTFGGYDGMLIWGVYPRIGVDERTQWEIHDDLPGGRAGLRAMARRARERGVRFFVPYKPWDRAADLRGEPAAVPDHEQLARLVADVQADGVFLDTMAAISPEFRSALDAARPGVVFCSEGRAKGAAFEAITGSWDQSPNRDPAAGNWAASPESMPAVDVWRFCFPEHRLFVVNRHTMGADRERIIQRGFFGGMGWVVWQDIFGLTLPFTSDEAALLKRCRIILRQHRQALWSATPTPLIPTSHPGVYCNIFPGESKRLWTLYNATDAQITIEVPDIEMRPGYHIVNLWNEQDARLNEAGRPTVDLPPRMIGAVAQLPCWFVLDEDGSVRVQAPPTDAVVEVQHAGGGWHTVPNSTIGPEQLRDSSPALVRLVQDGEVLDQIVVYPNGGTA